LFISDEGLYRLADDHVKLTIFEREISYPDLESGLYDSSLYLPFVERFEVIELRQAAIKRNPIAKKGPPEINIAKPLL